VAYWSYGYDMPDHVGGGFVTGELLLRADGVLLRRQTLFFPTGDGRLSEGFGPWEEVTWWEGEADPVLSRSPIGLSSRRDGAGTSLPIQTVTSSAFCSSLILAKLATPRPPNVPLDEVHDSDTAGRSS
jgi:hypothetical protein